MAAATHVGLRRSLAAALIVALTLAGLGRAAAAVAPPAPVGAVLLGVAVPICHSGVEAGGARGEGSDAPARPAPHGCCDDGALPAMAVLPAPPSLTGPAPAARSPARARPALPAPVAARPRDHRLPRGPPAA